MVARIMEKRISDYFKENRTVLSFEIFPPKRDTTLTSIDDTLAVLCKLNPDFISITFGAGGSANNNLTVKLAKKVKDEYGIEPVVHLTCLNYTKSEIDFLLEELDKSNIHNILALRGDRNPDIVPKEEFHYASELVDYVNKKGGFGISAACYPEGHQEAKSLEEDILHLKEKVDKGAPHLISQLFFDNKYFYDFQEKTKAAGINVPIDAGIMPVINAAQIERMVSVCGASLPDKFKRIMNRYADNKEALFDAGMVYALDQIVDLVAHGVDGIHIYTMNNPKVASRICDAIKNLV